ncbi:MAG: AI-2E family transporter [Deltaproteobacteria bacterium]|nr:AI-2E family transporter [Deltaproteobacteria bacterium]MBW2419909.1 AI-2E family transporter [Deltaproteobacteria bacterium]
MDPITREQRIQTYFLGVLTAVAVAASLYWLRSMLIPFVLAVFFSLGLTPFIDLLTQRLRVPRPFAILAALALLFVALSLVTSLITTSVSQLGENARAYQQQLGLLMTRGVDLLPLERLGFEDDFVFDPRSLIPPKSVGSLLMGTTNAIVDLLSQGLIVMIYVFFLLSGGSAARNVAGTVVGELTTSIKRYIVTQTILSSVTGLLVGTVLMTLGIDLALVFGLFAFLLNFIPSIGSIIATLLPLPVVLVSPEVSGTTAALAIGIPGAIQFTIGNLIAPRVLGSSLDLHPVTILLALMFWGSLWGVVGMLLATPIMAVLKMLADRFERTQALAHIMAGTFAETPVEAVADADA